MVKDAKVSITLQKVLERVGKGIKVSPQHIREYGVNNIFQRAFSYLLGWDSEGNPVKIQATKTGYLKIASYTGGYEHYAVNPSSSYGFQTLTGGVVAIEDFHEVIRGIEVLGRDNDFYIQLSSDGISWGDKLLIEGSINITFSQNIEVKAVKLVNRIVTGGNDSRYQVIGWW